MIADCSDTSLGGKVPFYLHFHLFGMLRRVDHLQHTRGFHLEYLAKELFFVSLDAKDSLKKECEVISDAFGKHTFDDIVADNINGIAFFRKCRIGDAFRLVELCGELL